MLAAAADWVEDPIQELVITRARELKLTCYAIAKATKGAVSENCVADFMHRRNSMTSRKLAKILPVLKLQLTPCQS